MRFKGFEVTAYINKGTPSFSMNSPLRTPQLIVLTVEKFGD